MRSPRCSSAQLLSVVFLLLGFAGAVSAQTANAPSPVAKGDFVGPRLPEPENVVPPPSASDAALEQAWREWQTAWKEQDFVRVEAAQETLRRLKDGYGISSLDAYGVGLVRAADARLAAGDDARAVQVATAAVELAPDVPMTHWALVRAYFTADATAPVRLFAPALDAATAWLREARFRLPLLADLGAALIVAVMATVVLCIGLLFLRSSRYALHDFGHLLPRGTAPWQALLIGVSILALPVIFRWGLVPCLLVLLLVCTAYLSLRERIVAGVAVALLGLMPLAAGQLISLTAYAGTLQEALDTVERGGPDASLSVPRLRDSVKNGRGGFLEHALLGHFHARRGEFPEAIEAYKAALADREGDPIALTHLGNALLQKGDVNGAIQSYQDAIEKNPQLAAPHFNLAVALRRRAAKMTDASAELARALEENHAASTIDPFLGMRDENADAIAPLSQVLVTPKLDLHERKLERDEAGWGTQVHTQLLHRLFGTGNWPLAALLTALASAAIAGLGLLGPMLKTSQACGRCGRPACSRCDPTLPPRTDDCAQCTNAFIRKGVVSPAEKARKQLEIQRFRAYADRSVYVAGVLFSGGGHVLRGAVVGGVLQVFFFAAAIAVLVMGDGLLRPPYVERSWPYYAVPAGIVVVLVYALSLRSLHRQSTKG